MRVILKQDVEKMGRKGDVINVSNGYGRNFLLPKKLAIEVTPSNLKMIEIERTSLKKKVERERLSFQGLIEKLNQVTLSFARRSGDKDVIFGSVSSGDIRDELAKLGFDIDKKKVLLDEPIKRLGNFTVRIKVYQDDRAEVRVVVIKEEAGEEGKGQEPGGSKEEKIL
jgi:large subunit ribosomal protein L9